VLVWRELGKGALQLLFREVEGVVVNLLSCILKGLEQQVDLSEIPKRK